MAVVYIPDNLIIRISDAKKERKSFIKQAIEEKLERLSKCPL